MKSLSDCSIPKESVYSTLESLIEIKNSGSLSSNMAYFITCTYVDSRQAIDLKSLKKCVSYQNEEVPSIIRFLFADSGPEYEDLLSLDFSQEQVEISVVENISLHWGWPRG